MIDALRNIWAFAGTERKNLNRSLLLGVLYAVFHALQIAAIYVVLKGLVENTDGLEVAEQVLIILAVSIAGRAVVEYVSQLQRVHAGYFMAANKRIAIGDRLKHVPMGYLNDTSLGRITGIATTVLGDVEATASMVLVLTLTGFLNTLILIPMLLIFEWHIGMIFMAGIAVCSLQPLWSKNPVGFRPNVSAHRLTSSQPYSNSCRGCRLSRRSISPAGVTGGCMRHWPRVSGPILPWSGSLRPMSSRRK